MNKNRNKILQQLSAKADKNQLHTSEVDQKLFDQIIENRVTDKNSKLQLFKQELEAISGECQIVKDLKAAAEMVWTVLKEQGEEKISTSGEEECATVLHMLSERSNTFEWIKAPGLPGEERKRAVSEVPLALVKASYGIADTGTLVFPYEDTETSYPHFLADTVIALLFAENITADQFELFSKIPETKKKNMVLMAGPSRTADIEKILILGAHGPRRLIVFILDS